MSHPYCTFRYPWIRTHQCSRYRGVTLIECVLAIAILAVVSLSLTYSATAGHQHLAAADQQLTALQLADALMEEIIAKHQQSDGTERATYGVADYDGMNEDVGELLWPSGESADATGPAYSRDVSVPEETLTIPSLGNIPLSGRVVWITVSDTHGNRWQIRRFIGEDELP